MNTDTRIESLLCAHEAARGRRIPATTRAHAQGLLAMAPAERLRVLLVDAISAEHKNMSDPENDALFDIPAAIDFMESALVRLDSGESLSVVINSILVSWDHAQFGPPRDGLWFESVFWLDLDPDLRRVG